MFLIDLLVALVISLLLVLIFSILFRSRIPWGSFWIFLLMVFLLTWAGGVWIRPFGPTIYNATWLPFLIFGIFIVILLAAVIPASPPSAQPRTVERGQRTEPALSALAGLTIFFWIILILTLAAILAAYVIT